LNALAAGYRSYAEHDGAFVWADNNYPSLATFKSTGPNQFLIWPGGGVGVGTTSPAAALHVVASSPMLANGTAQFGAPSLGPNVSHVHFGGLGDWYIRSAHPSGRILLQVTGGDVGIGTDNPATKLHVAGDTTVNGSMYFGSQTRQMLNLWGNSYGIGVQSYTHYSRTDSGGGFAWYEGGTHHDGAQNPGPGGNKLMSLTSAGLSLDKNLTFGTGSLRQMVNLFGGEHGIGVQAWATYFRTPSGAANGGFAWYKGGVHADGQYDAGGGSTLMLLNSGGLTVNGTFVSTSDRNAKENFSPVEPREILEKVVALPITRWNYKQDAATPHLGPVAQDFYAAFTVGPDDKHITTVDADGVALAAIQGLNEKVERGKQKAEMQIKELKAENAQLQLRLAALEKLIANLNPKGNKP